MSWVRLVTLLCDRCTARYRSAVTDLVNARLAAEARGWATARGDLCPNCKEGTP